MSQFEAIHDPNAVQAVEYAAASLAEKGAKPPACPNCGTSLIGPYCAVCGQERDTHRRSVWTLVGDLVEDVISFDSRILRTAIALLVEPGEIAIAFREGRTRHFVPALRLYFFVSLLFFLMLSATGLAIIQLEVVATPMKAFRDAKGNAYFVNPAYDPTDPDLKNIPKLIPLKKSEVGPGDVHYGLSTKAYFFAPIGAHHTKLPKAALSRINDEALGFQVQTKPMDPNSARQKAEAKKVKSWVDTHIFGGFQRLANNPAALNEPLTAWIPRVLFLLLPLYALLLAVFYWRQRKDYYFVDHLIFSLTIHTFTFVVLIVAAGLAQILPGEVVAWLVFGGIATYIFVAMKRFYRQGWIITTLKYLTVSFIYTCFFLLPALGGVMIYSFMGDPFG
ncbi:MAG TPA: DUF3667 domain-containing protein [Rhizomicrobium sp.]|nr:DUF3667 domain-containing protein [Rhizomicrobium sp.]